MIDRVFPLVLLLASLSATADAAEPAQKPFPGTPTKWRSFARYDFKVNGAGAIVVVPDRPLPGRPWIWRAEFFDSFADADAALVEAGWHLAYLSVPDLFGSPEAIAHWEKFHASMVEDYKLATKPGIIGLSRGGLYSMNWAAAHPGKTLAVYLDNAVCDFKSWPGGLPQKLGTGRGSPPEWKKLLAAYEFKTDAEAVAYKLNPVDNLAPLAAAKIPLLLVYGDKDSAVPHAENSLIVHDRYKALGGPVERIVKPGQDHHPHGLVDVAPVVKFFNAALSPLSGRVVRESIEWLDVWVPGNGNRKLPKVLLIGDSIARGYYGEVERRLEGKATVGRLTTSKSLGDPGLIAEVQLVLSQTSFDVVHVNNGLHGWGYSEAEYAAALPELIAAIRTGAPKAKVVWAATTPMRVADKLDTIAENTARVKIRNELAAKVMLKERIPIDDLFEVVASKPEWYSRDGVHLNAKGTTALANRVADVVDGLIHPKP